MHDSADRLDFAPPPEPAAIRAFVLAILAHVLLLIALTWGINWNREAENVAAEAELWSSVPQQAAPKVVQAPPLPVPPPPKPEPKPEPKVEPPPTPPVSKAPDIALEREKQRRELAERRQEELEREKKLEAARKKREELELEKKLEARKKQEELKRQEVAEQKAEEEKKKKAEELAKAKAKQEEAKLAALRKENLERMMKGATGAPSSPGTSARSSGPSASYAGRIAARIKPNIVFTDTVSGNPAAVVEIRVAPDGTIVGRKLLEPSGVKSWDEAVLRAIDKTEVLPRDTDGRVVPQFPIRFRPHD
jgi:colicin import membrane protein